jgi:Flp pilus assembly protein TadD
MITLTGNVVKLTAEGIRFVTTFATQRRRVLAVALASTTLVISNGCSTGGMSLSRLNPFSRDTASTSSGPGVTTRISETIAATAQGTRNQLATVGTTAKSAAGKTKATLTGFFTKSEASNAQEIPATDPLSLQNTPASVSPEVFIAQGQLWETSGNFPKSMECYTKALNAEPNNAPALTAIARLHFRQNNHQQAVEYFQRAIQRTPKDAGLYNDLGLAYSKLGNHTEAEKALQKSLELAPGTSRYANNLASVRFEAGDNNGAFAILSQTNKAPVAHFNMAYLHYKSGQMDAARTHLTQVVTQEAESSTDPAVKRAVVRSKELLATLSGAANTVAQASQALNTASNLFGAGQAAQSIQQTAETSPANAAQTNSVNASLKSTGYPETTTNGSNPAPSNPAQAATNNFTLPPNWMNGTVK